MRLEDIVRHEPNGPRLAVFVPARLPDQENHAAHSDRIRYANKLLLYMFLGTAQMSRSPGRTCARKLVVSDAIPAVHINYNTGR